MWALSPICLQLVLETAAEGVLREWLQRINAAITQQPRRQAACAGTGKGFARDAACPAMSCNVLHFVGFLPQHCVAAAGAAWTACCFLILMLSCAPLPVCCRPRRLLVFCNPFGGSRRARQIWESVVRPVFDKAGIKSSAVETQHGGHARALLTSERTLLLLLCQ